MKRMALLSACCIILLSMLSACDVITALEITPSPSPTPTPLPIPAQSTVSPMVSLASQPTSEPGAHTLPGDTVITFEDPAVEKMIRTLLTKPEGSVTVAEMRKIISFDYNPDIYSFANETIYSLDDLRYCENLEHLYITGNRVSDLSPLAGMKSLHSIWIGGNPVTDASAVLALPSLQDFNALHTGITDISALTATQNLQTFCCDSKLTDITPLFQHKNLQQVLLAGINDESFHALLSNCTTLTSIRIKDSTIKDDSLSLFKDRSFFTLDLENCGIHDISALDGIVNVEDLRFPFNSIEDISVLKKVDIIFYLDLRGNQVNDWSPLKYISGLTDLLITGNPVIENYVLEKLEKDGCKIYR